MFLCWSCFAFASVTASKSGFYAGIKAGYVRLDSLSKNETIGTTNIYSPDNGRLGWGINVGYQHMLHQHFLAGLELGYHDNGYSQSRARNTTTGATVTSRVESNDVNLLVVGKYIWNSGFDVFGKAGVARVNQRDHIYKGIAGPANPITRYRPAVNVGVGYSFYERWNASLEYRHVFAKDQSSFNKAYKNGGRDFKDVASIDAVYLGISYLF